MTENNHQKRLHPILAQKKLADLTPGEMLAVINSLGPKEEAQPGIRFLRRVLTKEGVKGVIAYVEVMSAMLDEEGVFEPSDFKGSYKPIFQKSFPKIFSRRTLLGSVIWTVTGPPVVVAAAAKGGDNYLSHIIGKEDPESLSTFKKNILQNLKNYCHSTSEFMDEYIIPPVEVGIGVGLLNEGVEKWRDYKLEGVANGIAYFARIMKKEDKLRTETSSQQENSPSSDDPNNSSNKPRKSPDEPMSR